MPKVKAPLFSFAAHGSVAKKLSYYEHGGTTAVKSTPVVPDARTLAQLIHRWHYQNCAARYHQQTPAQQAYWIAQSHGRDMTPFNAFLQQFLGKPSDLSCRYHFDRIYNSQALDSARPGNHGAVHGATLVEGKILNSLDFDGIDDYVQALNAQLPIGNTPRTVHIWIKSQNENFDYYPYPFFYGTQLGRQGFGLYGWINTKQLHFYGHAQDFNTGILLDDELWHLITITFDGTLVRTYDNAIESSGSPQAETINTVLGPAGLVIGSFLVPNQYWHGPLDEFEVLDYCQNQAEIARYLA